MFEVKLVPPKLFELLVEVIAAEDERPTVLIEEVKVVPPKLLELLVPRIDAEDVNPPTTALPVTEIAPANVADSSALRVIAVAFELSTIPVDNSPLETFVSAIFYSGKALAACAALYAAIASAV
jgi:hypothetical protein